jgi:hypothetical protein
MLVALTDRTEVSAAYAQFVEGLNAGSSPMRKRVGWPSGTGEFEVFWRPSERLWSLFDPSRTSNRYWCCFGPDDPTNARILSISCEINFAFEGINRRVAGVFLRDEDGRIYVGHSGNVGGGRKGVGKTAFLSYYDSPVREPVDWPDGRTTEMLVIGMLGSDSFVNSVAAFVSEVASFKEDATHGRTRQLPSGVSDDHDSVLGAYFPESLLGSASFEQKTRKIEVRLAHGPVVHALREAVESSGLQAKKNSRIDLAAVTLGGELRTIFEVKTAIDWNSVYGAIGQLMYYGKTGVHVPRRLAAVLPAGGPTDLDARLKAIGLDVVRYAYADGRPVFSGLEEALGQQG